jgi:hypothetical protein
MARLNYDPRRNSCRNCRCGRQSKLGEGVARSSNQGLPGLRLAAVGGCRWRHWWSRRNRRISRDCTSRSRRGVYPREWRWSWRPACEATAPFQVTPDLLRGEPVRHVHSTDRMIQHDLNFVRGEWPYNEVFSKARKHDDIVSSLRCVASPNSVDAFRGRRSDFDLERYRGSSGGFHSDFIRISRSARWTCASFVIASSIAPEEQHNERPTADNFMFDQRSRHYGGRSGLCGLLRSAELFATSSTLTSAITPAAGP